MSLDDQFSEIQVLVVEERTYEFDVAIIQLDQYGSCTVIYESEKFIFPSYSTSS